MTRDETFIERESNSTGEVFRFAPVALAIGMAISAVLPVFLTGALAVQIRENLNLTPSLLGMAVGTFFLFAALASFTSGHIAYRLDGTKLIKTCMLGSSVLLASVAFFATSYTIFVVILALGGAVNGALQPPINVFLSQVIPKRKQGLAFGIKQAAIPLSTFLAGLSVPLVALTLGWRYAFLFVAPLGVVFFFLAPRSVLPVDGGRATGLSERPPAAPLVMLSIGMGLGTGAANAFGAFIVSYAVHTGWNPGLAGLLIVLGSFIGVLSRIGQGFFADRRHGKHFLFALWSVGIGGVGYFMFALGYGWLIVPATIISYGAGWGWNGLFIFAIVRNFTKYAGYATGTIQSGSYVGSVLGPLGFGFVVEKAGYSLAWSLAAVCAVGAAVAVFIARRLVLLTQPDAVG